MNERLAKIPVIVLGGTGYVAGELLRLIAAHPQLELQGRAVGQPAGRAGGEVVRASRADLSGAEVLEPGDDHAAGRHRCRSRAIFSAAPHGVAAKLIDDSAARRPKPKARKPRVIDISADYRYCTAGAYEAVYKHAHGAPDRIAQFTCAVPEHLERAARRRMSRIRDVSRRRCCWRACRC